ncbi:MAG: efflux RND transporter periplasmic adaptor subunit [Deltaproteobacteria bacterium]|nr:efflux RND transporter periplasmic adaptor subunit [Deltaproteobacteria bacterium]
MNSKQTDNFSDNPESESKLHRSPVKFLVATLIAVVLIGTGVITGMIPRWRQQTELNAETRENSIPAVTVISPKPGQSMVHSELPAEIKPWVEAPIYARISGYLKQRYVDIGDPVEAGRLLATIDTPEQLQELERARGQLDQAEASLGISKITAARWAELLTTASVSEQDAAEKKADLKLKTAIADSARSEVRRLERIQAFSRVIAPFSGIITVRNIDSGDLIVAAGSRELFHLAQTKKLRVFVQVPQEMARSIAIGQTAEMTLPGLPGRKFTAKVIRTAGVITADSRTLPVELEADNPKGEILAGSYAKMRFIDVKMKASLTLPANTVLFRPEGPRVGIVESDGKVSLRSVSIGRDFGQTIEIITGVSLQDRVIVNPSDSLANGMMVTVSETPQTEKKP